MAAPVPGDGLPSAAGDTLNDQLATVRIVWENPIMKVARVDDRRRILIPELKPGQAFTWENNGNGQITLLEVRPAPKQPRKVSILDGLKPMTDAEAKKAFGPNAEFDALEHHCARQPVRPPVGDE